MGPGRALAPLSSEPRPVQASAKPSRCDREARPLRPPPKPPRANNPGAVADLVGAACSSQEQMISAQLGLLQACAAACPFQRPQRGSTTERMLAHAYASGIAQLALLAGALEQV